jgi:hypothetical protein
MNKFFKNDLAPGFLEELFNNDDKCLEYLSSAKWSKGFICRKCGNDNHSPGKVPFSRRCTRCKNEESATANTIFHNCKFPVSKAFYITYNVSKGESELSTLELARKLALQELTCWKFKNKVQKALDGMILLNNDEQFSMKDVILGKDKFSEKFKTL